MDIKCELKEDRRKEQLVSSEPLPFGQLRTDHMFLMNYDEGWKNPRIVPYDDLKLAPGAMVLHYAQEIFEGAKAFKHPDGEIYTFRLDKNAERLNQSAKIMKIPSIPVEDQIKAIHSLIDIEKFWFPEGKDNSLYIRPFIIGIDDSLGVKPSKKYLFCVILSPGGPYYKDGFTKSTKLLISKKFHRATPGGTGAAKAGGNYGASLQAGEEANAKGCNQVLYLDVSNTFIEEVGSMNHFHVTSEGEIIIPKFTDTILKSITSQSVLELFPNARQEDIVLKDFISDIKNGKIVEAGGFGTAAGVAAVGSYLLDEEEIVVGDSSIGPITKQIYEKLTSIQKGKINSPEGWLRKVDHYSK